MSSATASRSRSLDVSRSLGHAARLEALGRSRRLAEFEAGNLDRGELFAWAARYPEEVPLVNASCHGSPTASRISIEHPEPALLESARCFEAQ